MVLQELDRFGRLNDLVKNIFVHKLKEYFSWDWIQRGYREIPFIEKYEISTSSEERLITSVNIVMYFTDRIFEMLPLIAITTTGGRGKAWSVGFPYHYVRFKMVDIVSSLSAPYSLSKGDYFDIKIGDTLVRAWFLDDFLNVSADDIANYLIEGYGIRAYSNSDNKLVLSDFFDRCMIIVGGNALEKLGFQAGQCNYVDNVLVAGMTISEEMDVLIDVVCSDRNQRNELMDILSTLFGFYVFDENIGQWITDSAQILFRDRYSRRGESEMALGGENIDKLYFDSVSVPVVAFSFLDRNVEQNKEISYLGGF